MEMCMRKVGHKRLALGEEHMRAEQEKMKKSSLMVEWLKQQAEDTGQELAEEEIKMEAVLKLMAAV